MGVHYYGKGSTKRAKNDRDVRGRLIRKQLLDYILVGCPPVGHFKSSMRMGLCCVELPYETVLPSPDTASSQPLLGQCISVTYPRRTLGPRDPKRIGRAQ